MARRAREAIAKLCAGGLPPPEAVLVSPLQRALQTAAALFEGNIAVRRHVREELEERHTVNDFTHRHTLLTRRGLEVARAAVCLPARFGTVCCACQRLASRILTLTTEWPSALSQGYACDTRHSTNTLKARQSFMEFS